jgi:Rrf2 family protein
MATISIHASFVLTEAAPACLDPTVDVRSAASLLDSPGQVSNKVLDQIDRKPMKLSTKARYGVRAVFDIAYHNSGRPTQARDIAKREEIPLRYLEQIFQDLRRGRLVDAKRGPKGGYFLSQRPDKITLGDVIRAVQGPISLLAERDDDKSLWPNIWRELAQKVGSVFDGVTIQDLCKRGEALGIQRGDAEPHMYFI